MSNAPSKEYLHLFNAISCTIEDVRSLQLWMMIAESRAKQLYFYGSEADSVDAIDLLFDAVKRLKTTLQGMQILLIQSQQKAEELFINGADDDN